MFLRDPWPLFTKSQERKAKSRGSQDPNLKTIQIEKRTTP
jgi:hypothetical protein